MLTKIKIIVTPRLSKAVQEIVFANGGKWVNEYVEIKYINSKYLFINKDNLLSHSKDEEIFDEKQFKEIDPYAFIASNGELGWLPLIGERVEFSNDNENWRKDVFVGYSHIDYYKFETRNDGYKYCRPLKKQLSFKEFLEDNGVDFKLFLENCKVENQRFYETNKYYRDINELKKQEPENWLVNAFSWSLSLSKDANTWHDLDMKWHKLCNQNSNIVWE